jgi:hypothetical protein
MKSIYYLTAHIWKKKSHFMHTKYEAEKLICNIVPYRPTARQRP